MYIFQGGSVLKNPPANAGDAEDFGLIPGLGRSPGGGSGNHSSILAWKNSMDRGAWRAIVHGVANCQTCLSETVYIHMCIYLFNFTGLLISNAFSISCICTPILS